MRNNETKIWRDEDDIMEDDGRMVKNQEIEQLGNCVTMRDYIKTRERNLKYKNRNRVYKRGL